MEQFLQDKKNNSSANTLKQYTQVLTKVSANIDDIFDEQKLFDYINKIENANTKLTTQKVLVNFLKYNNKEHTKLFNMKAELKQNLKEIPNPKPDFTQKELNLKIAMISTNQYHDTLAKTLLYILVNENEQLRTDICSVKYKNHNKDVDAYYNDTVFYFNNTKKKNGKFTINLSLASVELINKLISFEESKKSDYLFPTYTSKGKPYADLSDGFRKYLYSITLIYFGKKLCMNDFRHLMAESVNDKVQEEIINKKITLKQGIEKVIEQAKKQNHSLETHLDHYLADVKSENIDSNGSWIAESISSHSTNDSEICRAIYDENWDKPEESQYTSINIGKLEKYVITAKRGVSININSIDITF